MRLQSITRLSLLAFFITALFACNKTEILTTEAIEDYMPMAKGKYITYRLDSLVFTNFGSVTEIHPYQEKHMIDSVITDNIGQLSYRVYIYQRDSAGTGPWVPTGTYYITPLADQVEWVDENNFRYIKMHLPLKDGFSWKGNKYLATSPYSTEYNFSNDDNMGDWDYYYDGPPSAFDYKGNNYEDVLSVEQIDEAYNVPITVPTAYAARSRVVEKYAKNIGLVFKINELWEYQPNPGGANPYKTGFGITMWMIDHN
jgi:hypothetical protein